ncbi:MAG: SDR family oxidoreductase [Bryobacterales bacterium]|nr:SDR family oxidoreductase [Bryobacterales bacterium]
MNPAGPKGKTALVTGGNHGIGAAVARALGAQGANVFIAYFRPETSYSKNELREALSAGIGGDALYRAHQQQTPEHVVSSVKSAGGHASMLELDLSASASASTVLDACEAEFGHVEILVNNHAYCSLETFDPAGVGGSQYDASVEFTSADGIDRHFAVNVRATVLLMAEFTSRHVARDAKWGRIINISTDAADAHSLNVSYAASKHAIESYSRSAASELGKYGITCNVVAPGPIQTGYITPELEGVIVERTPLGRLGTPQDVADVVSFLASDQARWVTGQLLYVGGGFRMPQ